MDATRSTFGALAGASKTTSRTAKTLLVHPFIKGNTETKKYLLETPKELKRKTPLLEIPTDNKRPKLYAVEYEEASVSTSHVDSPAKHAAGSSDMVNTSIQTIERNCQRAVKCHHCCCANCHQEAVEEVSTCSCQSQPAMEKCNCQSQQVKSTCVCPSQPVKVIFAPAVMPSIYGPVHGIPYVVKQPSKILDRVSFLSWI